MPDRDEDRLRMLLVADEDADLREFVRTTLEGPALHVFEAADRATALSLAKQVVPHVMLVGSVFGSETGEVVARLGEDPDTAEIRLVLLLDAGRAGDALAEHVDGFLARPFDAPELVAAVEDVLGGERPAN